MKIKYFAWVKDITNHEEENINSIQIKNLDELKVFIIEKYPTLKKHMEKKILRFAVNQEYIMKNITLKDNDEIAIFPPVSGG
ncbi:molybdopterin converting factor subunit 1 [Pelagibacterales bacterium SAG-MED31]|nr:molybdopterin converting factor subunit 1 [Pelagibacterales bacterium SAG-MED31]